MTETKSCSVNASCWGVCWLNVPCFPIHMHKDTLNPPARWTECWCRIILEYGERETANMRGEGRGPLILDAKTRRYSLLSFFVPFFGMGLSERGMGTVPRSAGQSSRYQRGWTAQLIRTHSGEPQASDRDVLFWPATGHPESVIYTTAACCLLFRSLSHTTAPSFLPPNSPLAHPRDARRIMICDTQKKNIPYKSYESCHLLYCVHFLCKTPQMNYLLLLYLVR